MANLTRSAKSSSEWGTYDLVAFNISVVTVDAQEFFGSSQLPDLSTVSPVILNNVDEPANLSVKADIDFFQYLYDATYFAPDEQSGVDDFTAFVLKMMRYDEGHRIVHLRKEMKYFEMCGQPVFAKADVCVVDRPSGSARKLLVAHEDKRHLFPSDPEAQLIADALAAVSEDAAFCRMNGPPGTRSDTPIQSTIFPGITMTGTSPTFYKIPVTDQLLRAITSRLYPSEPTIVQKFVPPVSNLATFHKDGMRPLDNRRICLQCFEAFRQFVGGLTGPLLPLLAHVKP